MEVLSISHTHAQAHVHTQSHTLSDIQTQVSWPTVANTHLCRTSSASIGTGNVNVFRTYHEVDMLCSFLSPEKMPFPVIPKDSHSHAPTHPAAPSWKNWSWAWGNGWCCFSMLTGCLEAREQGVPGLLERACLRESQHLLLCREQSRSKGWRDSLDVLTELQASGGMWRPE